MEERERRIATLVEEIGRDGIEDRGRDGGNLTQGEKEVEREREIERGKKRETDERYMRDEREKRERDEKRDCFSTHCRNSFISKQDE